ncbi:hypothetical protein ACJX0J_034181, partial [Zea mays]
YLSFTFEEQYPIIDHTTFMAVVKERIQLVYWVCFLDDDEKKTILPHMKE